MRAQARAPRHLALLPALLVTSALAWIATSVSADPAMRLGILTGAADRSMDDVAMASVDPPLAFALFMATWTLMMVAIMFPAVAPVVMTFDRWALAKSRPRSVTAAFLAGYLAIWSAIGLAAYGAVLAIEAFVPAGDPSAPRIGGVLLAAAGVYELTPLKDLCLQHCRSAVATIVQYADRLSDGHRGPFTVGVLHGIYCVGCCWSLMLVLVLVGMMNLVWMGIIAALIFAEKVLPGGRVLSRIAGVALIGAGAFLAIGWPAV